MFFGRSQFVAKLAERVRGQPLTVVLGASGTGKSSVVKAGLLPALAGDRSPTPGGSCRRSGPGKSPLASLAGLTLPGEPADDSPPAWPNSGPIPRRLAARVGAWAAASPAVGLLLLVVDQFEELITLCWDAGERDQFLRSCWTAPWPRTPSGCASC